LVDLVPSPDSSIARRGPIRFPFSPLPCVPAAAPSTPLSPFVLPLFLENGNEEVNIIPRQNGAIRNDGSGTSFGTRGIAFNEIVLAFADTNGQGVNGADEAEQYEFNDAEGVARGASENGGNGLNGVDGAAAGTHGNGENGKRIGPRLAIEESGEGTRSTNGGNEDLRGLVLGYPLSLP
jgi:hypothetical protein